MDYAIASTLTHAFEHDSSGHMIYHGTANAGSEKAAAVWRIQKMSYDRNGNLSDITWADGDTEFNNVWLDRDDFNYT